MLLLAFNLLLNLMAFLYFMSNVTLKMKHLAVGGVKLGSISPLYGITSD